MAGRSCASHSGDMPEEHDVPEIPDIPPPVPSSLGTEAAKVWSTKDSPAEGYREKKYVEFSPQSLRVIQAIQEGLSDPECTQIDGYGPGKISAKFRGTNRLLQGQAFANLVEYEAWLEQLVNDANAVLGWHRIEEERSGVLNLPGGERLTVILPPIAQYPIFSLRKHVVTHWQPIAFVENGTLSAPMMDFLRSAVLAKVNMLFVGAFGSGKTSILRALAQGIPDTHKIAVVEQVPELSIDKPLAVPILYQPKVDGMDLTKVLDDQMYFGLDHLIVGEVHKEGITNMLETMIMTQGSMSTYHAFSTEQAGVRMTIALQMENGNLTADTAISYIRQAVELVVVIGVLDGKHRVMQITELDWRSSGGRATLGGQDLFRFDSESGLFRSTNLPPDPNGRVVWKFSDNKIPLHDAWFKDPMELDRLQRLAAEHRH